MKVREIDQLLKSRKSWTK